jgi:hypothetical protein
MREKTGQCEIIGREKTMYYDVSKTNELNGIQPLACKQELCHVICLVFVNMFLKNILILKYIKIFFIFNIIFFVWC